MTDPAPRQRGRPTSKYPVKQNLTFGHEPQMGLDTKTDWPTDRRSQRDSDSDVLQDETRSAKQSGAGTDNAHNPSIGENEIKLTLTSIYYLFFPSFLFLSSSASFLFFFFHLFLYSLLLLFLKNKSKLMRSCCSVYVCVSVYPPIVARQRLGKILLIVASQRLGKNPLIVARQLLGKIPLIVVRQRVSKNPLIVNRQWLGKSPPIVARQRLGRNITAITNIHATIEELLDVSFSMWPLSYQGKYAISSFFFPSLSLFYKKNPYRILVERPEGNGPLRRPRRVWENNIKMDLRYGMD
jgi:hypothetical protein